MHNNIFEPSECEYRIRTVRDGDYRGLGASPCNKFTQEGQERVDIQREYFAWAQGFMSGILIRSPAGVDETLSLNPPGFPLPLQVDFLASYCIQNLGKSFTDAVINLYKRLREESGGKL